MTNIVSIETSRQRMGLAVAVAVHVFLCMLLHLVGVTTDSVH